MALIDLSLASSASFRRAEALRGSDLAAQLSELEKAAVDIGARDDLSSVRREGFLLRWMRMLFAMRRPTPLADGRLEAIRRLAVVAHFGHDDQLEDEARAAAASGLAAPVAASVMARFGRSAAMGFAA